MSLSPPTLTPKRVNAARVIAVVADALQIMIFPAFIEGYLSPVNDALDLIVALVMLWLVGWHWALLPSFVAEMVPGFDLVPTWTVAVFIATGGKAKGVPASSAEAARLLAEPEATPPQIDAAKPSSEPRPPQR